MTGRMAILASVLCLGLAALGARAQEAGSPGWWLEEAVGYAAKIQVPDGRAATLVSIGSGYLDAGLTEEARPLLAEAAAFGAKCVGCFAKAQRLADLALLQSQAGDPMAAEKTFRMARAACDEVKEAADRLLALAYLGARRQDAGDPMLARPLFSEAFAGAKALKGEDREPVLADLAVTFLVAGEEALATAALSLLGSHPGAESARLARIQLWTQRGAYAEAEGALAEGRFGLGDHVDALCRLALGYEKEGRGERARAHLAEAARLARRIEAVDRRVETLLEVARTAARLRLEKQAQTALREAVVGASAREDRLQVVAGLLDCARTAHAIGKAVSLRQMFIEIPRLADGIEDVAMRDEARLLVVQTAADLGEFVAAERALGKIEDVGLRAQAQVDLVEGYRDDDNCARALAIIQKLLPQWVAWEEEERKATLGLARRLAVVQAACGEPGAAAATVARIGKLSAFQAALACTYIARELR